MVSLNRDTFDRWRKDYDRLGFYQMQAFYNQIRDEFPQKPCYTKLHLLLLKFLTEHPELTTVMELGGYDGSLAKTVIPHSKVKYWDNFEIIEDLPQKCTLPGYNYVVLKKHFWDLHSLYESDVFVASHVFEHLKYADIEKIAGKLKVIWVFLEIPVSQKGGTDWTQFNGTHILEVGLDSIELLFFAHGYVVVSRAPEVLVMRRI